MTDSPALARIDERLLEPLIRRSLGEPSATLKNWASVLVRGV